MTHPSKQIVLVTVSGPDHPGITSELTRILAESEARILDIGQAVIHELLSLSILFELRSEDAAEKTTIKDLLFRATELGLKLDFQVVKELPDHSFETSPHRYVVTLIGDEVTPMALHRVAEGLAKYECNIDRIDRLSQKAFGCVEFLVSSKREIETGVLKKELLEIARKEKVDIALQSEGLFRRTKRLVVMDMDSTLIQNEVIDEFARHRGVYEEVAAITEKTMMGELSFDEGLRLRCQKLKGLTRKEVDEVYGRLNLTPGAEELTMLLKKLGYKIALISGGFTAVAERFKERLGIDYVYANTLEWKDDVFTGEVVPPILNAQRKADLLDVIAQQEKIELDQVVAIGDGANDLAMLEKAGLGIAFNAKPKVSERADFSLHQKNLRSILYLFGFSGREVEETLRG